MSQMSHANRNAANPAAGGILAVSLAVALAESFPAGSAFAATEEASLTAPAPRVVPMRKVFQSTDGAWTSPAAVILRSADEWIRWNDRMVADDRAYGAEPLPDGVDWDREIVLVVTLGLRPTITTLELDPPQRFGRGVRITGRIEDLYSSGNSTPCHVIALDRRYADDIELDPSLGTLEPALDPGDPPPGGHRRGAHAIGRIAPLSQPALPAPRTTWGAIKHQFH